MIKGSRFVSQVVLVGNDRKFPAALIVPNFEQLETYAKHRKFKTENAEGFLRKPRKLSIFSKDKLTELTKDLSKFEKVKKIALARKELTVEGGELTPTLKVKRRVVERKIPGRDRKDLCRRGKRKACELKILTAAIFYSDI